MSTYFTPRKLCLVGLLGYKGYKGVCIPRHKLRDFYCCRWYSSLESNYCCLIGYLVQRQFKGLTLVTEQLGTTRYTPTVLCADSQNLLGNAASSKRPMCAQIIDLLIGLGSEVNAHYSEEDTTALLDLSSARPRVTSQTLLRGARLLEPILPSSIRMMRVH